MTWGVIGVLIAVPSVAFVRHLWPATPRLSHVSCRWAGPSSFTVSGDITNPASDTRTFAIRPTFWLEGVGQVASDMHDYQTVPGHATLHWRIGYSMSDTAGFGTPVTRCGPYAYQQDRPAGD